jgi:hypothetical protein
MCLGQRQAGDLERIRQVACIPIALSVISDSPRKHRCHEELPEFSTPSLGRPLYLGKIRGGTGFTVQTGG